MDVLFLQNLMGQNSRSGFFVGCRLTRPWNKATTEYIDKHKENTKIAKIAYNVYS